MLDRTFPPLPDAAARAGRAPSRWQSRLWGLAAVITCLGLGTALGLGLTALATRSDGTIGATTIGPWRLWAGAGRPDINPYLQARFAVSGEIPLVATEGVMMLARSDDAGRPLQGSCTYRVAGPVPSARFWSLAVTGEDGLVPQNPAARFAFTSSDILRDATGHFAIVVSGFARPGNWLPLTGQGAFTLALRFYDTPITGSARTDLSKLALPSIALDRCF